MEKAHAETQTIDSGPGLKQLGVPKIKIPGQGFLHHHLSIFAELYVEHLPSKRLISTEQFVTLNAVNSFDLWRRLGPNLFKSFPVQQHRQPLSASGHLCDAWCPS